MTRTTTLPLFTEADLACYDPSPPSTHLSLTSMPDHLTTDIVADLEAMTPLINLPVPPTPPPTSFAPLPFAPAPPPLPQTSRPRTDPHPIHIFKSEPTLASPSDIAWPANIPLHPTTHSTLTPLPTHTQPLLHPNTHISTPPTHPPSAIFGKISKSTKQKRSRKGDTLRPSRFCHICARTQKSRKMYCANLNSERKCRKSVCEPCFIELRWDFEAALSTRGKWLCPHCRGICGSVPRARCHIYTRTNEKRKAARLVT